MVLVINPGSGIRMPDRPRDTETRESGLVTPKDFNRVTTPIEPGTILKPKGYQGNSVLTGLSEEAQEKYSAKAETAERPRAGIEEAARAFGNLEVYFRDKMKEAFPEHQTIGWKDSWGISQEDFDRTVKEKSFYNRETGRKEIVTMTKPGRMEEEAIVSVQIAGNPSFAGTKVDKNAIERASALLRLGKIEDKWPDHLPEMPDLVHETETYLRTSSATRSSRARVYDLINQLTIPPSEISTLGRLMDRANELHLPLAYRLLVESPEDGDWYKEQMERRASMLSLLGGTPTEMVLAYPKLKELADGLVCSVDVKHPPTGKVGVEIEYSAIRDASLTTLPRFKLYEDVGNDELSRDPFKTVLDATYLQDLTTLADYLRQNSNHISSLHLHLDRDMHPKEPIIGGLLANLTREEILKSWDKNTWEVRGLLPPVNQNRLSPALIADIIQLYISASSESQVSRDLIDMPENSSANTNQIIFGHICKFVTSAEGRLAALKIVQHPLTLKALAPEVLAESFSLEGREKVVNILERDLVGQRVENGIRKARASLEPQNLKGMEILTAEQLEEQYESIKAILIKNHLVEELQSGLIGIKSADGMEFPFPSIEEILGKIGENKEVLETKMKQGFQKLLIVPFELNVEDLVTEYTKIIKDHYEARTLYEAGSQDQVPRTALRIRRFEPPVYSHGYSPQTLLYPTSGDGEELKYKEDLLRSEGRGWRVLLVEDLQKPLDPMMGVTIYGRAQIEFKQSADYYFNLLRESDQYQGEAGLTLEDWVTYSIIELEKSNNLVDSAKFSPESTYLANRVRSSYIEGLAVLSAGWDWFNDVMIIAEVDGSINDSSKGFRTVVRII